MLEAADEAFGSWPAGEPVLYSEARIEAVVAEIRFAGSRTELTADDAARGLELLAPFGADRVDVAEQREFSVVVAPDGVAKPESVPILSGWQYSTPDRSLVFTLMPNSVSVQTVHYARWSESLRPHLDQLIAAAAEVCQAGLLQRVGLRYINRLQLPADATTWCDVLNPAVLGVLGDDLLGPKVTSAQQHFEVELDDRVGAVVRHGPIAGTPHASYLIDLDVFSGQAHPFDQAATLTTMQRLNRTAVRIFGHLISDAQATRMGRTALDDEERS